MSRQTDTESLQTGSAVGSSLGSSDVWDHVRSETNTFSTYTATQSLTDWTFPRSTEHENSKSCQTN